MLNDVGLHRFEDDPSSVVLLERIRNICKVPQEDFKKYKKDIMKQERHERLEKYKNNPIFLRTNSPGNVYAPVKSSKTSNISFSK